MNARERSERIVSLLVGELAAQHVEVVDDSERHRGHLGAGDAGHFRVLVVSERFRGLPPVAAHRLVYRALEPLMATEIHALELDIRTPEQSSTQS